MEIRHGGAAPARLDLESAGAGRRGWGEGGVARSRVNVKSFDTEDTEDTEGIHQKNRAALKVAYQITEISHRPDLLRSRINVLRWSDALGGAVRRR